MRVGKFAGIDVYIHWTFWLLVLFYLVSATSAGGIGVGLYAVAFVLSVFACIVLHEFGHAAAAAKFGIPTADITLLPIGGVARLTRMPEIPYQELVIALAGPAVNVVIGGILFLMIALGLVVGVAAPGLGAEIAAEGVEPAGGLVQMDFLFQLLAANVILVVFNMLPAFPMDGGRVLRSLIAMRTGHLRATEIAARVGRWMAFAFGIYGLVSWSPLLIVLAVFIFLAGTAELFSVRMRNAQQQAGNPRWGTKVWPQQATSFQWSFDSRQTGSEAYPNTPNDTDGDVIDAVEVKHLR